MALTDQDYWDNFIADMDERFELIFELLDSLKDVPSELKDVKEMLTRLEHDHDLFYKAIKQQHL